MFLAQELPGQSLLNTANIGYLLAAVCFIMALKLMNSPITARKGNWVSIVGMILAIGVTFLYPVGPEGKALATGMPPLNMALMLGALAVGFIGGAWPGRKIAMTNMPQMVALLNGLGGGSVALVSLFEFMDSSHH